MIYANVIHSPVITDKQIEVIKMLLEGSSPKEIAYKLEISESAVRARIRYLRQNLHAKTTIQAVGIALANGAVSLQAQEAEVRRIAV